MTTPPVDSGSLPALVFPSKRDAWLVAIIDGGAVLAVLAGFAQLRCGAPLPLRVTTLIALVGAAALMLWVFYGTSYVLGPTELVARCGPFRHRVPLRDIQSITPSRDPRSSPASSLDRLLVVWPRGSLLISPDPKRQFLDAIQQRCSADIRHHPA